MSSPSYHNDEASSTSDPVSNGPSRGDDKSAASERLKPPAKRPASSAVIEISDTESDDSDICAVSSYQASADEVKRIRGDEYSSTSSSSSDYSSDSESQCEDDSFVIKDKRTTTKAVRAQLFPRANRMEDPKLNSKIQSQELIDRLRSHWQDSTDVTCDEATLTADPFRVCLLHNFLSNSDIINNIVDDMNTLDWSRKKMDLYEFHQTTDLASLTWQRSIRGIYELLKTEVMAWVSQVTGLELTSVSASCSLYGPGDHLLVHDDLMSDRRVAFILYLAPWRPPKPPLTENGTDNHITEKSPTAGAGWSPHMGGALELLARDELGPTDVVRRIYPHNNMLAFFKVGTDSYHQVSEVVSLELPRLSINGWFHGPRAPGDPASPARAEPPPPPPPPQLGAEPDEPDEEPPPPPPANLVKLHTEVVLLGQWVNACYMSPRARAAVQAQVERSSEAALRDFLQPPRVAELLRDLEQPDVEWTAAGPRSQRRHSAVSAAWAAARPATRPLRALLQLFGSLAFSRLLADCTDLVLAGTTRLELQRWRAGDFELIPPRSEYQRARLEAVLYLGEARGAGRTTFVAPEEEGPGGAGGAGGAAGAEDAALVSLPPDHNTLNLVYCDAGAASFRKYVSKLALRPQDCFYVLACTYVE